MTCIVGIADGDNVYIGGDRSMGDDSVLLSTLRPKVVQRGEYLIGYAGSMGIGQLMHYIKLPVVNDTDPMISLRIDVVEEMKSAIESYSAYNENNETDFLIGVRGRLFEINTVDWQVAEYAESAVGSGSSIALGSLYTTRDIYTDNRLRAEIAVNAAIALSPNCIGPVDILSI